MSRTPDTGLFEHLHEGLVKSRRVRRLVSHLEHLIPFNATVLDVGCGSGELTRALANRRTDLTIHGIDVHVRPGAYVPVSPFDGETLPWADRSVDVVLLIDVLHHTPDPMVLLREARRAARHCVVIKDHLLQGPLAGATLRFMDRVGNARHRVPLPNNYWTPEAWRRAFSELGLAGTWYTNLGLYPWPAGLIFERSLHFLTVLERSPGVDPWEDAYARFESPAEEIRKFTRRLESLGCGDWPRDADIVELFCGRGSSLKALSRMGFHRLEGVELSASLARKYTGPEKVHVADCRSLPFADHSKDVVVIQGGLHHLAALPEDLRRTLGEAHRVLRRDGRLVLIEPWMTPFLRCVHLGCRIPLLCRLVPKLDALKSMIDREAETYFAWLAAPELVLSEIGRFFELGSHSIGWGKLKLTARPRIAPDPAT